MMNFLKSLQETFSVVDPTSSVVERIFFESIKTVPKTEWTNFAYFDQQRYSRNLLAAQENFSLLLCCWEPGQSSPVHSHAHVGTMVRRSWVLVLEGDMMWTEYSKAKDDGQRDVVSVKLVRSNDPSPHITEYSDTFHSLENINRTARAVTLHLFCPAYLECCWNDKDGVAHSIPVSYTPICNDAIKSTVHYSGTAGAFYTSFDALAGILTDELRRGKDIQRITRILESLRFNPKEFRRYAHWNAGKYTRNLIGYNAAFTLLMLCWDCGQESPIHDHAGSNCFMKILEGELHEVRYDASDASKLRLKAITQLRDEAVAYIDDTQGVHKMVNPNVEKGAISLHIYIPPYTKCSIFNLRDGTKGEISMVSANSYVDKPFTPMQLDTNQDPPIVSVVDLIQLLQQVFKPGVPSNNASHILDVQKILNRVRFEASEWMEHVHFSEHNYTRMLLTFNENFSLVLICWNANQSCPLHTHDHAPENTMFVKTILGGVRFRRYEDSTGSQVKSELVLEPDSPCLAITNKDIGWHTTSNSFPDRNSLSLHLYTPPMLECVHQEGVAPVVYCEKAAALKESPAHAKLWLEGGIEAVEKAAVSKLSACAEIFCDFRALLETLRVVFEDSNKSSEDQATTVSKLLAKFEFNPKEVAQYKAVDGLSYTRRRIAKHDNFEVFLVCWRQGQTTPIHDHGGSSAWMKVLEGQVCDTHFSKPARGNPPYIVQTSVLKRGDVAYLSAEKIHQTKAMDEDCCSISIYSPPYAACSSYCGKTGEHTELVDEGH